jgi:hypothetical protein
MKAFTSLDVHIPSLHSMIDYRALEFLILYWFAVWRNKMSCMFGANMNIGDFSRQCQCAVTSRSCIGLMYLLKVTA